MPLFNLCIISIYSSHWQILIVLLLNSSSECVPALPPPKKMQNIWDDTLKLEVKREWFNSQGILNDRSVVLLSLSHELV